MNLFINKIMSYITPCVSICTIDPVTNICIGCKRSEDQIKEWPNMTHECRMEVMRTLGFGYRMSKEERLRRYDRG